MPRQPATASAPKDLRSFELRVGARRAVVFSYPIEPATPAVDPLAALTEAERDVLRHLLRGARTREVALARGSTVRTVNKQVEALYRKLNVHSRSELAAAFSVDRQPLAPITRPRQKRAPR